MVYTYNVITMYEPETASLAIPAFRQQLRQLERQIEQSLQNQTRCCGVSIAQCHALLELAPRQQSSIGELAEALELDASTLSRTVDSLVRSGLVERQEDPANRRRQIIRPSQAGMGRVQYINMACDDFYAQVFQQLGPDKTTQVVKALPVLVEALRLANQNRAAMECCPDYQEVEA